MGRESTERADPPDPSRVESILVLLEHEPNRELVSDRLRGEYRVIEPHAGAFDRPNYDLCIVDASALSTYREALQSAREGAGNTFLPTLLIVGRRGVDELPNRVWEMVDEVIEAPVDPRELGGRIQTLLRTRRTSMALERERDRSEARFRSLFRAVPDPVVVTRDGEIVDANDAFEETFQRSVESMRGESITSLDVSPPEAIERCFLRDHGRSLGDVEHVEANASGGSPTVLELNVGELDTSSALDERIGVFRDVTDLRDREQELRRQNEELKRFARTVAHDLRNPLTIAQAHVQLAAEERPDERLDIAMDAYDRIERLVEELLTLARLGQLVLEPELVSLEAVSEEAWNHVETVDATLVVEGDLTFRADSERVNHLLENLFRNAIEHAGRSVTVYVGPMDGGFYVEDDGPGIPESDRDEIFETGYTTHEDGTGFGLSILRQIVNGHGWSVGVVDGRDGGARFEIGGVDGPLGA